LKSPYKGGGVPNESTRKKSVATLKSPVQCRRWPVEMNLENTDILLLFKTVEQKKKLGSGHSKYPKRV